MSGGGGAAGPHNREKSDKTGGHGADDDPGACLFRLPWRFLKGVVESEHLPPAIGPEIAFAGRSNVGKSSLINALVGAKGLARTSNTPGRTQEINYFIARGTTLRVVDLPGYGFAKAPRAAVSVWTALVRAYLAGRPSLVRTLVLIDARHGLKPVDLEILDLLDGAACAHQIVLTKADKIGLEARDQVIASTTAALARRPAALPLVLATSAETGEGVADLRTEIALMASAHGG